MKLEEERRQLEEEIIDFYKMKAASGTLQTQECTNIRKDKDRSESCGSAVRAPITRMGQVAVCIRVEEEGC